MTSDDTRRPCRLCTGANSSGPLRGFTYVQGSSRFRIRVDNHWQAGPPGSVENDSRTGARPRNAKTVQTETRLPQAGSMLITVPRTKHRDPIR